MRFIQTQICYRPDNVIVKAFNVLIWKLLCQDFVGVDKEEAEDDVNESEGGKKGANEIQMCKWKVHFDKSKNIIKVYGDPFVIIRDKKLFENGGCLK